MLCPTGTAPAVQLVRIVPTTERNGLGSRFLAQFFNLNYSDYTEIHLLKRDETLALINDASTDLSLRGLLCPLRGKASEFLHPKSSLTASCACACICDDVYRYQKMSPQATFSETYNHP